mgnify:FL=1
MCFALNVRRPTYFQMTCAHHEKVTKCSKNKYDFLYNLEHFMQGQNEFLTAIPIDK